MNSFGVGCSYLGTIWMKLSRFTHFKSNLSKSVLGAWATGYLVFGGARIDGIICGWICGEI